MRTMPGFEDYLDPLEEVLNDDFIPTLFSTRSFFSGGNKETFCGLGIISPKSDTPQQYQNSTLMSGPLFEAIKSQSYGNRSRQKTNQY